MIKRRKPEGTTLRERAAVLGVSRQRVEQLDLRKQGRCISCRQLSPFQRCLECARALARHRNAKYRETHPDAREYTCGVCGEIGHNSRTCTEAA